MGLFGGSKSNSTVVNNDKRTAASENAVAINTSGSVSLIDGGAFNLVDKLIDEVGNLAEVTQASATGIISEGTKANIEALKSTSPNSGFDKSTLLTAIVGLALVLWFNK